jgi:type I restriction enzyme R subunit
MRQALINENADLVAENPRYVMRITGGDAEGQAQLGNFMDPESRWPVLVTTSRLLSTGVDVQTCRLIVLDREVGSMTEFKQIVGRGTRVHEDTHKYYFTLIDFRGASSHFADPDFDGEPVQIYEPKDDQPVHPPDAPPTARTAIRCPTTPARTTRPSSTSRACHQRPGGPRPKIYVDGIGVAIVAERVEYLDEHGKLVTESLRDFTKRALRKRFASLDDFLKRWKTAERTQAILEELAGRGPAARGHRRGAGPRPRPLRPHLPHRLRRQAPDPPRARRAGQKARRLRQIRRQGPRRARRAARQVRRRGRAEPRRPKVLRIAPFSALGTPVELIRAFGGKTGFEQAVHDLQSTPTPISTRDTA